MLSAKFHTISSGILNRNGIQILFKSRQLYKNLSALTIRNNESNMLFREISNNKWTKNDTISFSTEHSVEPSDPDVFGEISGYKFEKAELDDDEKEQDDFEKNESAVPRRFKMSPGQYAKLISKHIAKGDLYSAMNVLELVKNNRDKPTTYMYNLLIRGFAMQGNLKKCFKLYNDMKKRALKHNGATYTSIFNACGNSSNQELAIEILNNVRHEMLQKNVLMNETHYNVMVKAYGKHQQLLEAFQLVDEMVDKRMSTDETTFNSLLYASISDKANGLRHALVVWHLMQQRRIKPTILTFNLLLRAIRDTQLGNLKINDHFIKIIPNTQIILTDGPSPDLLSRPPCVTHLALTSIASLPAPVKPEKLVEYKSSSPASSIEPDEHKSNKKLILPKNELILNDIQMKNKLILFGGYTGFIERMEANNVTPNMKTLTLLMDIVPDSLSIENDIIQIARTKKISFDIDFFNMLIKKRCKRKDDKNAKKLLDEIQLHGLIPNIATWGVLALGCRTRKDAHALIEGMEATSHTLNPIIATTLLGNACAFKNFYYVLDIMEIMHKNRIKPTEVTYTVLDKFQAAVTDVVLHKKMKPEKERWYREMFSKFNLRYSSWQTKFGREKNNTKIHKDNN